MQPGNGKARAGRGLVVAGVVCAVLALVIPLITAAAAVAIGVLVIVRNRVVAGIVVLALAVVLGVAGLFTFQAFIARSYRVPSEAMEPTLKLGQRVLINRLAYRFGDPAVGDIVVFHPPRGSADSRCGVAVEVGTPCSQPTAGRLDAKFIKRIVAGPGDRIAIRAGRVVLNGRLQRETFIKPCPGGPACNLPREATVPRGHYFMLGDNRGASSDSRFWGPVPKRWIIGPKLLTY